MEDAIRYVIQQRACQRPDVQQLFAACGIPLPSHQSGDHDAAYALVNVAATLADAYASVDPNPPLLK